MVELFDLVTDELLHKVALDCPDDKSWAEAVKVYIMNYNPTIPQPELYAYEIVKKTYYK